MALTAWSQRRGGFYVGGMLLSTVFSVARVFAFAWLLDQTGFGQYTYALLIFGVVNYLATAGLAEGLGREVPMLRGQGRHAEASAARDAAVTASVVTAGTIGAVCALALALYARSNVEYLPLPWVGLIIAATVPCNLLLTDLAGRELSLEYALMLVLKNATSLAVGVAAIGYLGVAGALIGEAVGALVTMVAVIALYSRGVLSMREPVAGEAWRVARVGLPFMLSSVVLTLTLTLDRWFVQSQFGMAVLGEYAFAFLLWTSGMLFSNVMNVYLSPRIVARFARTGDLDDVFAYVRRLGLRVGALFLAALIPALWVTSVVIDTRYPQYAGAKGLLLPVYLGTMFWSVNFYHSLFVIRGEGRFALGLSAVNGLGCLAALAAAAWMSAPLIWYAIVFCLFRFIYLVTCIATAKSLLFAPWGPAPALSASGAPAGPGAMN